MSVPRCIFFTCPLNVAHTALQIQAYAQSSTACPVKNPIPLSTQSVAAASLMTCRDLNVLSVGGKVLEQKLERHHVRTEGHWVGFHWEEFQAFRTFFLTCSCGWKAPVKVMHDGFYAYFLHNLWESHVGSKIKSASSNY